MAGKRSIADKQGGKQGGKQQDANKLDSHLCSMFARKARLRGAWWDLLRLFLQVRFKGAGHKSQQAGCMGNGQGGSEAFAQHSEGIKTQVWVGDVHQGTAHAWRTGIQFEAGPVVVCLHCFTDGDGMQHFPAGLSLQTSTCIVSRGTTSVLEEACQ